LKTFELFIHEDVHNTTNQICKTVINLSGQTPNDGVSSLLQKGLNYAVTPCTITTEDILAGVEKAVQSLPVDMVEEARQETVRIIKSSSRPRNNITRAEREALRTLKNNTDLSISPTGRQRQCASDSQHY
jgi:hypothetical protein